MTLRELLDGIADAPALEFRALTLDSRAVGPGDVFVALRGGTRHGLEFAHRAIDAGAIAVLHDAPPDVAPLAVPAIAVPALRARLGEIASRLHGAASAAMTVVGVTGTNGKTSTVQLVAQALHGAGRVVGTIGTLGAGLHGALDAGERTTPDVITTHALVAAMQRAGAAYLAMEVSSHALEQGRIDGIAFDVAVFTNLTRDHLDYHGTMQAYGAAKARLFRWPTLAAAVVNVDDAFGRELLAALPAHVRRCGYSAEGRADAELRASAVETSVAGLGFTLESPEGRARIASRLIGRFNVSNLLAVAGVLRELGLALPRIAAALSTLVPVPGRMNRLGGDASHPLVVVDYAHTPDALEQALQSLRAHTAMKLVCVFGCGGERDAGKRPQMGAIAERLADVAIVTDDNPRGEDGDAIVAQVVAGFARPAAARIERDRERAIALALALARPGDAVLIAGKGHETYQEVRGARRPFDDYAVAQRLLAEAA
ncbi:MAG TPA: UDP-N-acetylmuramoyl-L-alanyl-D-glutamate--2,6-diaminopimelate ligase [Candidatus Saccharimonadia bacterium]|nr:UDP-N-acetylmuramoyl-L-alanyl-D-glutamate--2,6-diaminopimelate ligase [Candidatus Saccharimonadia bacterium]